MTRATDGSASATSRPGRARSTPDRTRPAGARRTRSDTAAVADGPRVSADGSRVSDDRMKEWPLPSRGRGGALPRDLAPEEAALWLWAWPDLLDWPVPIHWLFSFRAGTTAAGSRAKGNGGAATAGILWGVDDDGELLLVHAAAGARSRRVDVMRPFVTSRGLFHESAPTRADDEPILGAAALGARWRALLDGERAFLEAIGPGLRRGRASLPDAEDGLLPGADRCRAIRRWPTLCAGPIAERIASPAYDVAVQRALARRSERGDPPPHYVGLLLARDGAVPGLTRAGLESLRRVCLDARPSHVHVRALLVAPHRGRALFVAQRPTLAALTATPTRPTRRRT